MPTRNIKLTDRYDRFVEEQIEAGRFRDASEVMRAGLSLLEQRTREEDEKLTLLRALAKEGLDQLDQGEGIAFDGRRQLAAIIRRAGRRAAASVQRRHA